MESTYPIRIQKIIFEICESTMFSLYFKDFQVGCTLQHCTDFLPQLQHFVGNNLHYLRRNFPKTNDFAVLKFNTKNTPTKHQVMLNQKMMFDITTFDSYSGDPEVLFEQ